MRTRWIRIYYVSLNINQWISDAITVHEYVWLSLQFYSLLDGLGVSFAEGIIWPQASQMCCDTGLSMARSKSRMPPTILVFSQISWLVSLNITFNRCLRSRFRNGVFFLLREQQGSELFFPWKNFRINSATCVFWPEQLRSQNQLLGDTFESRDSPKQLASIS